MGRRSGGFLTVGRSSGAGTDNGFTTTRLLTPRAFVAAVRRLDGREHGAWVSAVRGAARMDVLGDARGCLIVYLSEHAARPDSWSLLMSPDATVDEAEVVVDEMRVRLPQWQTVRLPAVTRAARRFAATGRAHPALTWYRARRVYDWRIGLGDVLGELRPTRRVPAA